MTGRPVGLLLGGIMLNVGVWGCAPKHAPAEAGAPPKALEVRDLGVAGRFDETPVRERTIDQGLRDGIEFLIRSQNADGSWGTGTVSHGNEVTASVPGSHKAFRVAVTALCVMALREAGEAGFDDRDSAHVIHAAHAKGVEYLATQGQSRREEGMLLYTFWANTYATQALAAEIRAGNTDPRVRAMAQWHIDRLSRYATYLGGWNYYDFDAQTQSPSMGPTSFGSSAGLLALWEARRAGLDVPQQLIDHTLFQLEIMHLPTGAYLYGSDYKMLPYIMPAHMVPGSLGRTQAANLTLLEWNSKKITPERAFKELGPFFTDHGAMEMGRKKPYPHESWYQVSGYYYYFGQYYASRLIEYLGEPAKTQYIQRLATEHVLQHQEADGSWWDYAMWDYHKPYGTAFAVMTLLRCR